MSDERQQQTDEQLADQIEAVAAAAVSALRRHHHTFALANLDRLIGSASNARSNQFRVVEQIMHDAAEGIYIINH